jgi:hypothetical protein
MRWYSLCGITCSVNSLHICIHMCMSRQACLSSSGGGRCRQFAFRSEGPLNSFGSRGRPPPLRAKCRINSIFGSEGFEFGSRVLRGRAGSEPNISPFEPNMELILYLARKGGGRPREPNEFNGPSERNANYHLSRLAQAALRGARPPSHTSRPELDRLLMQYVSSASSNAMPTRV